MAHFPHSELSLLNGRFQGRVTGLFRMLIELSQQTLQPTDLGLDLFPQGIRSLTRRVNLGQLLLNRSLLGALGIGAPAQAPEVFIDFGGSLPGGAGFIATLGPTSLQVL